MKNYRNKFADESRTVTSPQNSVKSMAEIEYNQEVYERKERLRWCAEKAFRTLQFWG